MLTEIEYREIVKLRAEEAIKTLRLDLMCLAEMLVFAVIAKTNLPKQHEFLLFRDFKKNVMRQVSLFKIEMEKQKDVNN